MNYFEIDGKNLNIKNSIGIIENNIKIKISGKAVKKVIESRNLIEKWINGNEVVYGVNTGFGEFKDVIISPGDIEKLQVIYCILILQVSEISAG